MPSPEQVGEKSGGNVNYYLVEISHPKRPEFNPYVAECEDIIEALQMTFAEGCAFKALWRSCAARTLGKKKAGGDAVYDAEKLVYYGNRMLVARKRATEPPISDEFAAIEKEQTAIDAFRRKHPEIPLTGSSKRWLAAAGIDIDAVTKELLETPVDTELLAEPDDADGTEPELADDYVQEQPDPDTAEPLMPREEKFQSVLGTLQRAADALGVPREDLEVKLRAELALASCNCCAPLWQEPT